MAIRFFHFFFISGDKFGSECFFVVFGDSERLVVLAGVACVAGPAGSSVRANFFPKESYTVLLAFRFKTEPKRCEPEKQREDGVGGESSPSPLVSPF